MNILNVAAYRFVALDHLPQLRAAFKARGEGLGLKGTILLAGEGINLVLAGAAANVEAFLETMCSDARFASIGVRRSWSTGQPFNRLLAKIKREIVSMHRPEVNPCETPAPRLAPQELKRWLDQGQPVVLLDARNQFEVNLGTFENTLSLGLKSFSDFPRATQALPQELKGAPVVTFCTGGIRCEKAAPWLIIQGFREVYQLDGGILNYFAQCGGAHFRGECFVFDQRVALDAGLRQTCTAEDCAKPQIPA
jgi:UPF0176 protein